MGNTNAQPQKAPIGFLVGLDELKREPQEATFTRTLLGGMKDMAWLSVALFMAVPLIFAGCSSGSPTSETDVAHAAKIRSAEAQIAVIQSQLDLYESDLGSYPTTWQGLSVLCAAPDDLADATKWLGPYAKEGIPLDPWSNPYAYQLLFSDEYQLSSCGPDGVLGTIDDISVVSE